MKKPRKQTRRGTHYRALAEGYAIWNSPIAASFRQAADHFDQTDPPYLSSEADNRGESDAGVREDRRSISAHDGA